MGRSLSHDLRDRVLKASKGGLSARRCAERFGVAASTAIRWIDRAAKGETKPRKPARRASCLDAHEAFIGAMIEERKDITLDEMVVCLADECAVKIGRSAPGCARAVGHSKKDRTCIGAGTSGSAEAAPGMVR